MREPNIPINDLLLRRIALSDGGIERHHVVATVARNRFFTHRRDGAILRALAVGLHGAEHVAAAGDDNFTGRRLYEFVVPSNEFVCGNVRPEVPKARAQGLLDQARFRLCPELKNGNPPIVQIHQTVIGPLNNRLPPLALWYPKHLNKSFGRLHGCYCNTYLTAIYERL